MGTATETPTRRRPSRVGGGGLGGAWKVIVMNDDHNTFEGVAFALAAVLPGIGFERGLSLANRIHDSGSAVVWSGTASSRSSTGRSSARTG